VHAGFLPWLAQTSAARNEGERYMVTRRRIAFVGRCLAAGAGLAAAAYGAYVATAWYRYGHTHHAGREDADALLDKFMPTYDVAERHHVRVAAPAEVTLKAATEMDLQRSAIVRGIFKARELAMGSQPARHQEVRGFLPQMRAIGWGLLAEIPGREIVMGAVTQPWMADVLFRPLPPEEFVAFHEPDYVKIAWTLRADSLGVGESIFRTETRVVTTDSTARGKFRRYWSVMSPGIILIRWMSLRPLKADAERRARAARADSPKPELNAAR
jgi:hypothetical protein